MSKEFYLNWIDTLSLSSLLINLAVGTILSLLLRWHFKRFGSVLSNKDELGNVLPLILLITILIITIVKSSLALSLGLVGALSIVRFRTPIKEPEELAYLFFAIAIGLGLGANQTTATVISVFFIAIVISIIKWSGRSSESSNLYLKIDWINDSDKSDDEFIKQLNEILDEFTVEFNLRRLDIQKNTIESSFILQFSSSRQLDLLIVKLREKFPAIGITFIDQNQLPSV